MKSHHKVLVFFSRILFRTILPHHISDFSRFGHLEVLDITIDIFVPNLNLSDNRQNIHGLDVGNSQFAVCQGVDSQIVDLDLNRASIGSC